MNNINEILGEFDPSLLFTTPTDEEKSNTEVIDASNDVDGDTMGTTIPAPENITTNVEVGNTDIETVQPPVTTDEQNEKIQKDINKEVEVQPWDNIELITENSTVDNSDSYFTQQTVQDLQKKINKLSGKNAFEDLEGDEIEKQNNINLIEQGLDPSFDIDDVNTWFLTAEEQKRRLDTHKMVVPVRNDKFKTATDLVNSITSETSEEEKEEILNQATTIVRTLDKKYGEIQGDANAQTAKILEPSYNGSTDFTNEDDVLAFYENAFKTVVDKDKALTDIQDVILKENEELLLEKQAQLQASLSQYQSYQFEENYFTGISRALTGKGIEHDSFIFSPQQEEQEASLLLANKEYTDFVNNLITSDPRFKERITILNESVAQSIDPQITAAMQAQQDKLTEEQKAAIRARRLNSSIIGTTSKFDDLGLNFSVDGLKSYVSGSNSLSPFNPYRVIENILGYETMSLSNSLYTGISNINLDDSTGLILMNKLLDDQDRYDSFVMDEDEYNNRINKREHTGATAANKFYLRSKKRLLPEGDQSLVYWDNKRGEIVTYISNYSDGKPIYTGVSALGNSFKKPSENYIKSIEDKNGWKLMTFAEAKDLMKAKNNDLSNQVMDHMVGIMQKEHEAELFSEEQFTDFLSNVMSGNVADALRFIPKTILKQVPYMAANLFSAGTYTLFQEGGNLTFDLIQNAAAADLGIDVNDLTTEQMLSYMENNDDAVSNKIMVGVTGGAAIAGLERAGIGYMIKSMDFAKSGFSQLLKGNVRKALSQSKKVLANQVKTGLNESLTEGLQTGVDQIITGRFDPMEYVNSMGEGFIGGVALPIGGAFVSSTINRIQNLAKNTRLNIRDPKFYEKANKVYELARTDLDAKLKAGTITEVEYDKQLNQVSGDRDALLKIPKHFTVEAKQESFELFKELTTLRDAVAKSEPSMVESETARIKDIEARLKELSAEQGLIKQIGQVEGLIDPNGNLSMRSFDTTIEADAFIEEQNETGNWDSTASSDGNGTILQNKETGQQLIIVDKQNSAKVLDIAVADHEFLHALMFQTVKDNPAAQQALGSSLLSYIEKIDADGLMSDNLKERYKVYKNKPINDQYEEALNFLADAFINEEIAVNDGILDKLGRMVRNLLGTLGVPVKFNSGQDVYNFVKDYAVARKKGKGLNKSQRKLLTTSAIVGKDLGKGVTSQISDIIKNQSGDINIGKQSKRTAQELMLQYQELGTEMNIDLQEDLISQYYSLGLKAMGYDRAAGDIKTDEALNFLNSEFPSIARNYNSADGSLSNYMRNTIGPRGKGFFQTEIERKKRTVSKEKLEDKGRQIVDTDTQVDFDQRVKEDIGRAKVYPSSIKVIENNITSEVRAEQTTNIKDDINRAIASDKTNPKQTAKAIIEQTKTKEYRSSIKKALGKWNSDQYNNNVDNLITRSFIKTLPIAQIKRRFGKLFNIKEIDRVPTVKIENGKRTDFKKPVYLIPEITTEKLNEIKNYFKAGEKRHQSLMSLIAEGVAVEQMEEIKSDKDFMNDLQSRLEIKNSNLTADQFIDEVIFNIDKRNLEDKSFDIAKASTRSKPVSKVSKNYSKVVKASIAKQLQDYDLKLYPTFENKFLHDKMSADQVKGRNESVIRSLPELGLDFFEYISSRGDEAYAPGIANSSRSIFNKKGNVNELRDLINAPLSGEFIKNNPSYVKKYTKTVNGEVYLDKDKLRVGTVLSANDMKIIREAEANQSSYANLSPEKRIDRLKDPNFRNNQAEKTNILKKILNVISKDVRVDKKIVPARMEFWATWINSQVNNSKHPIRVLAPIEFFSLSKIPKRSTVEGYKLNKKGEVISVDILNYVAEHLMPANNTAKIAVDLIYNNTVNKDFSLIKDNYVQGQLLKTDDNYVNDKNIGEGGFKSQFPSEFWNMDKPNVWVRYLLGNPNINLNEYVTYKNGKVMTIAESLGLPLGNLENNPDNVQFQNKLLKEILLENKSVKSAQAEFKTAAPTNAKQSKRVKINKKTLFPLINANGTTESSIEAMGGADKAAELARALDTPSKGISVFDFDDTLAYSNSKVIVKMEDGTTRKITPAEFASEAETLEQNGAEFNFDEFNKVVDGKKGPLADLALKRQDKFGSGDIFVLTARPQASAESIKMFLDGIGLNLPIENITGLENGSADAKALWVLDKAAKGYNNFYFADDAIANVQAVKNILDQIDVKSKVQIAKQSKRERISKEFNVIIEQQSGKEWFKTYSTARAKVQGKAKNKFEFFIPPSAEDFVGLMYKILPKGKNGDRALVWIKENLLDPYNKAEQEVIAAKISVANDFNELRKSIDNIPKNLQKQAGYSNFTWSQALRVYMWNMQDMDIPGLSVRDKNALVKLIEDKVDMKVFAEKIIFIQKDKEYPAPSSNWVGGSITSDIINSIQKTFRKQTLQPWQENVDAIFSEDNINKLEALYGSNYITALKNILNRMKRGNNRPVSSSKQVENVIDWLNNSVGTIMFLNRKSALLQLISSVNFINWSDNNIVAAGKAFANQPQYWKDVMYLMNSDYLVQRRNGMKINVAESEIADASKKGGLKGVIAYLLNKGFVFTRIADSLAIATGGATFYRNRVNALQKQVNIDTGKPYTESEASTKAFDDFYQISEESQQSSRADRISMQQASGLGRLVLNFANTPMQYARIIKKSTKDLLAGRGDWKTNLSKIVYYGAVQNLIFSALQAAVFTLLFDEEEEKKDRTISDKAEGIGFSMLSSLLRGLGYGGALVDTIVAVSREVAVQSNKKSPDFEEAVWSVFDFSPAIDSKVRKLRSAANTFKYNKKEIARRGFNLENPAYLALGQIVSSTFNVPLDRALRMAMTLKQASDQDVALWQRIALLAGYSSWSVNLPYWGTTTTIERETKEDEEIKTKYKKEAIRLKKIGYKRIPMTKGKPKGKLNVDFIEVARPTGSIEYWLTPVKNN